MKKITKTQLNELAKRDLESGNPYIARAIKYMVGNEVRYLYAQESMNKEEIDNAYMETAMKDIKNGYNERAVGYYDKWYRYSRADEGRAYDLGVRLAADTEGCKSKMIIIGA